MKRACLALTFSAALAGPAIADGATPRPPAKPMLVKLARIIDGDTLVVRLADGRAERIRIAGIDTAELRARCAEEERLALTARTALAAALASSPSTIRIVEHGRDRYDRLITDVLVDGQDVGRALVTLGIARVWTGRREPWCR